jgi:hypothetical protein
MAKAGTLVTTVSKQKKALNFCTMSKPVPQIMEQLRQRHVCCWPPNMSRRAESKRYPSERTDSDDDERRRMPYDKKYKPN